MPYRELCNYHIQASNCLFTSFVDNSYFYEETVSSVWEYCEVNLGRSIEDFHVILLNRDSVLNHFLLNQICCEDLLSYSHGDELDQLATNIANKFDYKIIIIPHCTISVYLMLTRGI